MNIRMRSFWRLEFKGKPSHSFDLLTGTLLDSHKEHPRKAPTDCGREREKVITGINSDLLHSRAYCLKDEYVVRRQ